MSPKGSKASMAGRQADRQAGRHAGRQEGDGGAVYTFKNVCKWLVKV